MSTSLKAGKRQINLSNPVCMGIVNVTPDSFSDGGELGHVGADRFKVDVNKVLCRAKKMIGDGAVFIDVGGESTRPGAKEVPVDEELDRVIPVVEAIARNFDICISVDTSKAVVIKEAINAGAEVINDIRGLKDEAALVEVANSSAAICLMHMQGQPRTMQDTYTYDNVVSDVLAFLKKQIQMCQKAGISRERLLVDPGFGFGKSLKHNYQLLKHISSFEVLQLPILVGISRKAMIGDVVYRRFDRRLAGSIAATIYALIGGAKIIRTHDVAATIDAIRVHSVYLNA